MQAMAPTRPTELQQCRIRLAASPSAVAEARKQVRVAIAVWDVPVDADTATLLVSELVTNAMAYAATPGQVAPGQVAPSHVVPGQVAPGGQMAPGGAAGDIEMVIRCLRGRLRVDVHDASPVLPEPELDTPADAETGRGLMLVDTLADEWGFYRTTSGKAVYFSLKLGE
ncbi:MAG: ATP-binding protein [Nocardiopsaceae bacterium]|nr:ATP-binding protein [Nocardiopsaceae bacterium]